MTLEIIHLKQMHRDPDQPTYDNINYMHNKVVRAQYDLAKYLTNNPGVPVVAESLSLNSDCNRFSDICNYTQKSIFPNGFPGSFEQLNGVQKAMFYQEGADFALMFMGILPKVYKSINPEDSAKIHDRLKDLSGKEYTDEVQNMNSMRENFALDNAARATNEGNKVFIIFGRDHDFKECDERGFKLTEASFEDHYNNIKYVNYNPAVIAIDQFMEAYRYHNGIDTDTKPLVSTKVKNALSTINNDKTTITITTKGLGLGHGQALKNLASVWADKTGLVSKNNDNGNPITASERGFISVGSVIKFTIPNNSQQYDTNMLKIIDNMNCFQSVVYSDIEMLANKCSSNIDELLFNKMIDIATKVDTNDKHNNWYYNIYPGLECSWHVLATSELLGLDTPS